MGWMNDLTVVTLKGRNIGNDIVFATVPIFTRISCEIKFFNVWEFRQTHNTVVKVSNINEVYGHV